MALFGLKKDAPAKGKDKKTKKGDQPAAPAREVSAFEKAKLDKVVILRPHITEKATTLSEERVYTFEVARDANKIEIMKAIKSLYKVTPVAVRIVNNAPRREISSRTRRPVMRTGKKKAYVTLKKGDQISFV